MSDGPDRTAASRLRHSAMRVAHRVQAGVAGGLLAAAAVAGLFFVEGALRLQPLVIPTALASALFGGAGNSPGMISQVQSFVVLVLQVLGYTVLHLLTFAAVGATAAFILNASAFWKSLAGGVAYTSIVCTGLLYVLRWYAGTPVAIDVLGLPRVLLANALAGAIIGTALYLEERGAARDRV